MQYSNSVPLTPHDSHFVFIHQNCCYKTYEIDVQNRIRRPLHVLANTEIEYLLTLLHVVDNISCCNTLIGICRNCCFCTALHLVSVLSN